MYHSRFKGNYYKAGYQWGNQLYQHHKFINQNHTFVVNEKRKAFADECIKIYQEYYPEILEEIKGIADGQRMSYEDLYTFLLSMYCFEFQPHCTCLAVETENQIIFGRNSDFLVKLEKLYMNCLYQLDGSYSFNGNTTAFVEIEDGVNEHGLAIGLTFICPRKVKPGFNAGILVRYLLEKCCSTKEVIDLIKKIPIASSQTLTIADRKGELVVIECNCEDIEIIEKKQNFVVTTNQFQSAKMNKYNIDNIDDWQSKERYENAYYALKNHQLSFQLVEDILKGKYGFMCQYDRKTGADTVWSVIYCLTDRKIYRVEGNPCRKKYKEDKRNR